MAEKWLIWKIPNWNLANCLKSRENPWKIYFWQSLFLQNFNSFTGIFQRTCLDFQNTNFSEHHLMALRTFECAEVDRIYLKPIKPILTFFYELLIFMKCNFKINLKHKPLPLLWEAMGNNICLRIHVEVDDQEKKELFWREQQSQKRFLKCPTWLVKCNAYITIAKT